MSKITRKEAIKRMTVSSVIAASPISFIHAYSMNKEDKKPLKGNIQHSVCKWCYPNIPLESFCEAAKEMGLKSVELLDPDDWKVVQKFGLTCAMANGSPLGITNGFNDAVNHKQLLKDFQHRIPLAADLGLKNIICFSGNRNGISEKEGLDKCAQGLDPVVKLAERYDITVSMELLNSKLDHEDYQCDRTPWGVALADKLGSSNFKLLYDIYHMQIMEGDIIATIKKYNDYISHYHTGGVPGRAEIDSTQELNYPAIMEAIVSTGFKGYVAQEFIPKRDTPLESLQEGIDICDV